MATPKTPVDVPVEEGKVSGVRTQFLLQGDQVLAHRLQDEEFGMLYNRNRSERQVARKDVPLARVVQTEEEERQQKEAMQRMENLKKRTDEDAEYAHQMMKDEMLRKNEKSINDEEDARLAKMIERQEMEHLHSTEHDARLAIELQRKELMSRKKERIKLEAHDMSYAHQLQDKERRLAQLMQVERQLRSHHTLPAQHDDDYQQQEASRRLQTQRELLRLRSDESEGGDDLFDIEEEQQLKQDQEMAQALQELEMEQKRATSSAADNIVSSDARLARIMQEQERLDALLRREQKRIRREQRGVGQRPVTAVERQGSSSGAVIRHPPPYDSVPPHYGQQSSAAVPPPAPPLPPDDLQCRRAQPGGPQSAPAAFAQRPLYADHDAGRAPVNGPLYIGPMGRSMSTSSGRNAAASSRRRN